MAPRRKIHAITATTTNAMPDVVSPVALAWDADGPELLAVDGEGVVAELDGAVGFGVDELLETGVVEMVGDADDGGTCAWLVVDAEEDVGSVASEGVGEGEDVFDDFAFLVVGGGGEGILGLFEVERGALVFPEECFDGVGEGGHVFTDDTGARRG